MITLLSVPATFCHSACFSQGCVILTTDHAWVSDNLGYCLNLYFWCVRLRNRCCHDIDWVIGLVVFAANLSICNLWVLQKTSWLSNLYQTATTLTLCSVTAYKHSIGTGTCTQRLGTVLILVLVLGPLVLVLVLEPYVLALVLDWYLYSKVRYCTGTCTGTWTAGTGTCTWALCTCTGTGLVLVCWLLDTRLLSNHIILYLLKSTSILFNDERAFPRGTMSYTMPIFDFNVSYTLLFLYYGSWTGRGIIPLHIVLVLIN